MVTSDISPSSESATSPRLTRTVYPEGQKYLSSSTSGYVRLHSSRHLVAVDDLSGPLRRQLEPLMAHQRPAACIIPTQNHALPIVPLGEREAGLFSAINEGCSWNEAVDKLSLRVVRRLFVEGVLSMDVNGQDLTGPYIPLVHEQNGQLNILNKLQTDPLSLEALTFAARIRLKDISALSTRIYLFNQKPVFASAELERARRSVQDVVTRRAMKGFYEVPPPPENAGWHFFKSRRRRVEKRTSNIDYKLYLSPSVSDLAPCLSQLYDIIPQTEANSWKVGRDIFGVTRSDKICVYFASQNAAEEAGRFFVQTLNGIQAQGIPFTKRYDMHGLVSAGIDPPRPEYGVRAAFGTSWRDWISRKVASAILVAQAQGSYPMTPVDAALWSMKLLGVDPATWTPCEDDFWRN